MAEDPGLEMLAAAHSLLNSERLADEQELLITTCIEALDTTQMTSKQLLANVNEVWPGADISADNLAVTLDRAIDIGVGRAFSDEDGEKYFALTDAGQSEAKATQSWFEDAIGRLAREMQERALKDFGALDESTALTWARALVAVFTEEMSRTDQSYSGALLSLPDGSVRPRSLDGSGMLRAIDGMETSEGSREFLKACLLSAVDELDSFGNEIVGYVATSCVLHAVVAGRSRESARVALGSLKGQRVVLDTPILVAYLGPAASATRLETVVSAALGAGMEVIAPEHVFDELDEVIDRVEREYVPSMLARVKSGRSAEIYAQTVNEQVLELFLASAKERKYKTWENFAARARGLRHEFSSLGVVVRPHGNSDLFRVEKCSDALNKQLLGRSARGQKQVERDAHSMEMVWRSRRDGKREKSHLWPGGWLVSYDKRIAPAFRLVDTHDFEPMVLTPAQWATLINQTQPAPKIAALIGAAASYLRQETMLRLAVRYPASVALDLSTALSGQDVSDVDVRLTQITLVDLLDQANGKEAPDGARISTEIARKRNNRMAAAAQLQREAIEAERIRLLTGAARTEAVLVHETRARKKAEADLGTAAQDLADLQVLGPRRTIRTLLVVLGVITAGVLAILGFYWVAIGTVIGVALFLLLARRWTSDAKHSWHSLLLAAVPELLGLFEVLRAFSP